MVLMTTVVRVIAGEGQQCPRLIFACWIIFFKNTKREAGNLPFCRNLWAKWKMLNTDISSVGDLQLPVGKLQLSFPIAYLMCISADRAFVSSGVGLQTL